MLYRSGRECWAYVSRLESHDQVAQTWADLHGAEADADRVRRISAAFLQGRKYFESAASSDIAVKPVLLYHGAMSLAVGFVLLKGGEPFKHGSRSAHGLALTQRHPPPHDDSTGLLDLPIIAEPGVFSELAEVSWSATVTRVYEGRPYLSNCRPELRHLGPVMFGRGDVTLTLGDLLARSKHTGVRYADITGRPPELYPVRVALHDGARLTFEHPPTANCRTNYSFKRDDPSVPMLDHGRDGTFVVGLFPHGDNLNEFIKLYLTSFVLGMAATDFPSRWTGMRGSVRSLLIETVEIVHDEFVKEFAQQVAVVLDDPSFFGPSFGRLAEMQSGDWRTGLWEGTGFFDGDVD